MDPKARTYVYLQTGVGFNSIESYDELRDRMEAARSIPVSTQTADEFTVVSNGPMVQTEILAQPDDAEAYVTRVCFSPAMVVTLQELPSPDG